MIRLIYLEVILYHNIVDINGCIDCLPELLRLNSILIVSNSDNIIKFFSFKVGFKFVLSWLIDDYPALLWMIIVSSHKIRQFIL